MWEWLTTAIDTSQAHEVDPSIAWHGRAMVLAWGVLAPLAVIVARYFKIMPRQNWPQDLDNVFWWRSHWIGQTLVLGLSILGYLVMLSSNASAMSLHALLGYTVLFGVILQVLLGFLRGSKGGPTAPASDGSWRGHHYDMSRWRRMFEALHKSFGYALLALAGATIILGLVKANAPNWMWLVLVFWWGALILIALYLEKSGMAVDTYQAIWGDDPAHPGNQRPAPGWWVRRPGDKTERNGDVRDDRGDRIRSP